ncbi:MAG: DUF1440 domain-containing protein [Thermomicrobiales bacterium]
MRHDANPWRGIVIGLVGGIAGTVVMGGFWRATQALAGADPRAAVRDDGPHALDDISIAGKHAGDDESSTAAIGRIAYERLTGGPPESDETKATLSYVVHYAFGALNGGLYGAWAEGIDGGPIASGALFGTGLWLAADEATISLLGLAPGPTKYPLAQHASRLGAHIAFGIGTSLTTSLLRRIF